MIDFTEGYVYDSHWLLSDELFTKSAKFTLKPSRDFSLGWSWPNGLPAGVEPPVETKGVAPLVVMEAKNIPAFQIEDDMPPEEGMKFRVDFNYTEGPFEKDADRFWKREGKKQYDRVESFVGKKKAMEDAVGTIVAASDTPEVKLQKIYARVQQIRNTSYEVEKTDQEQKRAQQKGAGNAEDVWKRGYGDGDQITLLFLGLTRAAGLDASVARISTREEHFFVKAITKAQNLRTFVVVVKMNGKDVYFDPVSAFTPYGMLPWPETNTPGLKLNKDGGTWIVTSLPESGESQIERKATLKLTQEGSLEGKLTVTFQVGSGLASRVRAKPGRDDSKEAAGRSGAVRGSGGYRGGLDEQAGLVQCGPELVAEFDLKVPGWLSVAGSHALLPVGIFGAPEKHIYEHTNRVHPLYYHYMSQKVDDVTIELPLGWKVTNLPKPGDKDAKLLVYTMKVDEKNGTLHIERRLKSELVMLDPKYYPAVRNFYESVRTGDEEQIVLQPMAGGGGN